MALFVQELYQEDIFDFLDIYLSTYMLYIKASSTKITKHMLYSLIGTK